MDLRERVVAACDAREGTKRAIAERFKVSEDWIYKLFRQRQELGTLAPQYHRRGRKAVFQGKSLKRLKALVDQQPDRTLEELRDLSGKSCSIMAVARALDRLGGRYKKRRSTPANRAVRTSDKNVGRGAEKSRRSTTTD
jgi:transposase